MQLSSRDGTPWTSYSFSKAQKAFDSIFNISTFRLKKLQLYSMHKGVSHGVNVDVKNPDLSIFFEKIFSADLKEVVSIGAIYIIGVKQGKNKEKD